MIVTIDNISQKVSYPLIKVRKPYSKDFKDPGITQFHNFQISLTQDSIGEYYYQINYNSIHGSFFRAGSASKERKARLMISKDIQDIASCLGVKIEYEITDNL